MATYTLNFSLTTDTDRLNHIAQICSQTTYSQKQLTQMADYILLASNKNHPDSPFIYPEEFSNPKREHIQESLDELLDDSHSEEGKGEFMLLEYNLRPIQPTIYKKTPRKLDRSNPILQQNTQMQQLWNVIDEIDYKLKENPENYKLSKMSIALHKEQYNLLEAILPQWPASIPSSPLYVDFYPWQRGIQLKNGNYADLDLTNYLHMAKFLKFLPDLIQYCSYESSPHYMESDLYTYLTDVRQAILQANLIPLHVDVLQLYWLGWDGKQMIAYLKNKYGKNYNQPTLSTMFNTTISKKICTEYTEIYLEKLYKNCPEHWRTCRCCGKTKLLTTYNFHRASGKPKGFSLTCKECFKEKKNNK